MYWHIETDIVGLFASCLLLLYQIRLHPHSGAPHTNSFTGCLWTCVGVTIIDIFASVVMECPTNHFVYHLLMTLYFVSIVQVILSWFYFATSILYADDKKAGRIVGWIAAVPYIAYAAMVCSNPWTGLIYSLGENFEYARGPLFFIMLLVFAAYTLVLIALTIIRRRHVSRRYSAHVLLLVPVILAFSIYFQLANDGWLVIMPGYMICLLLAFLFLQSKEIDEKNVLVQHLSLEASTDSLTGLLNRAGAETGIDAALASGLYAHCLVVIVDVDNLKGVNDLLGHDGGDRALIEISRRLKDHFRVSDTVARFGGDEFVAYIFGSLNEEQIRRSLSQLSAELTRVPIGDTHAVVNASIGGAWGAAVRGNIDALFHRADAALYHVKRNGKNGYALYDGQSMPDDGAINGRETD